MDLSQLSPDDVVYVAWGGFRLNATIVFTWIIMLLLVASGWWIGRTVDERQGVTRWQLFWELVVETIVKQISDVIPHNPRRYVPFIGTLFLFIAVSNSLAIVPGFVPPTASLSTTTALALCVLVAVPFFGIREQGLAGYLRIYIEPSPFMLPFNVIGELSRTLALAVRLFGNMMSGAKIAAILLLVAPLLFPVLTQAMGLLTGLIQAYIFAMLALVYIASALRAHPRHARAPSHGLETAHAASGSTNKE